jgi:hypothetical protein
MTKFDEQPTTTTGTGVHVTSDVQPQWLNVVRRLQSACSGNRGHAVVSVKVLVDGTNSPVCWTEPELKKIEPKSLDALVELLAE